MQNIAENVGAHGVGRRTRAEKQDPWPDRDPFEPPFFKKEDDLKEIQKKIVNVQRGITLFIMTKYM